MKPKFNFKADFKVMMKNRNYIFLIITYICLHIIYNALGAAVSFITKPYGYTAADNSLLASILILCGVPASCVVGIILDKYHKYKLMLYVLPFGSIFWIATFFFTLPSGNVGILAVSVAFLGVFVVPIVPVGYSMTVEVTYPIPEALSNGFMMMIS